MSYEHLSMWTFTASEDPCPTCEAMQGVYSYEVARPHPNCACTITTNSGFQTEVIATREELVDEYESAEEVTWVPHGGESSVSQDWSTGTESTVTGEVSAEGGGVGASLGGSESESSSAGGSKTVTFRYDDDLGGASQMIIATYLVRVYQKIETHRYHWSGEYFELEVIAATREERSFTGYHTEAF